MLFKEYREASSEQLQFGTKHDRERSALLFNVASAAFYRRSLFTFCLREENENIHKDFDDIQFFCVLCPFEKVVGFEKSEYLCDLFVGTLGFKTAWIYFVIKVIFPNIRIQNRIMIFFCQSKEFLQKQLKIGIGSISGEINSNWAIIVEINVGNASVQKSYCKSSQRFFRQTPRKSRIGRNVGIRL